jgi:hypothetical protein
MRQAEHPKHVLDELETPPDVEEPGAAATG